jgi:hypothetical protein
VCCSTRRITETSSHTNSFYSLDEYFNVNEEKKRTVISVLNSVSDSLGFAYYLLNISHSVQPATFIYLVMHSVFCLILYKL